MQYVVFALLMQPITGLYHSHTGFRPMLRAEGAGRRVDAAEGGAVATA